MSKTLLVDCQVLQTVTWDRGMGKYTYNILLSLRDVYPGQLGLLFNTNLPFNEPMRKLIAKEFKQAVIFDIDLHIPGSKAIKDLQAKNVAILNDFVQKNDLDCADTAYFIPCLFLWPACPVFPTRTTNLLLQHDIIPLLYHESYFPSMQVDDYLAQYKIIFEADHTFTVSQSVCDDMQVYLGVEGDRVTAINGASIINANISEKTTRLMQANYKKPFVIMPTGNDLRKNNQRAVKAFEDYLHESGQNLELVITSFFTDFEKQELARLSQNIRFSGNVSDEELAWLFKEAQTLLFVSESEGLGLPILDAVTVNQKVVCSDIPVFREISEKGFYYADPYNPESIKNALHKALSHKVLPQPMQKEYHRIAQEFTWRATAQRLVDALSIMSKSEVIGLKKVAIFGPKPSSYSAIGKAIIELHPALSRRFQIDYYFETSIVDDKKVRPNYLNYVTNCYDVNDFDAKRYSQYDAVIYHMGNSENHLVTAQHALAFPGIMIVHDTHMPNIYKFMAEEGRMDKRRIELEETLNIFVKDGSNSFITSLVNSQLGLVVHSDYAEKVVQSVLENEVTIKRTNLAYGNPAYNVGLRQRDKVHLGLGGILASVKGLELVEKIAGSAKFADCIIEVFGFNFAESGSLERLSQYPNIRLSTNLTDQEFQNRLASLDILLNYRMEYRGETSSTVLEAMRYGVVPIVRNVGWYSELPADCAIKVDNLNDVLPQLEKLVADKAWRLKISLAGKELISKEFLHEFYAQSLDELIENIDGDQTLSRQELAEGLKRRLPLAKLLEYVG